MKTLFRFFIFLVGLTLLNIAHDIKLPAPWADETAPWWLYVIDSGIFVGGLMCLSYYLTGQWFYIIEDEETLCPVCGLDRAADSIGKLMKEDKK